MKPSIRNRLLLILLSLTAATWLFTLWSSYRETQHEVREILDAQLTQSARSMLLLASHELEELAGSADHIHFIPDTQQLNGAHPYELKLVYQIWYLPNKTLVMRSANAPPSALSESANGYSDRLIEGEEWRIYTTSDQASGYQIQVGQSYALRTHLIKEIAQQLAVPNLLALPLLAFLISLGIHRALRPLRSLADTIARRAPQSLAPVVGHDTPREIEPLVEALNQLFHRLEDAFEKERRFTADAAHELRTPLAALKVQAQVAQRSNDAQEMKRAIDNVISGVDRATRLVEQLLTLARLDPQQGLNGCKQIALYPLTAEVVADLDVLAHARNIVLSLEGDETLTVHGQQESLRMLITNLIDNALRYTPEGGSVQVALQHDAHGVITLTVDDSGPGIDDEEREQVLQRFYRGRDVTASGSGLGLSIVKRIADLHSARLTLDRAPLGGLRVEVCFPPATP